MHVLIHAQHLSGVGHLVRGLELARALLHDGHAVTFVEGGRAVPRRPLTGALTRCAVPVLRRRDGVLGAGHGDGVAGATLEDVLAERRRRLVACARATAPDVLLLEHYPFSKWELEDEFLALIAAVRAVRPDARVVCSVREVCAQTPHEKVSPDDWRERVNARLAAHFDGVLVHGDPRFTDVADHFLPVERVAVDVVTTGFVCEPLPTADDGPGGAPATDGAVDVLSSGGGAGEVPFLGAAVAAWRRDQR